MGVAVVDEDPNFTLLAIVVVLAAMEIDAAVVTAAVGTGCIVAWPITDDIVVGVCPVDLPLGAAKSTGSS